MGSLHGSEIKTLRKKLKLTQDTLSDLIGCGKKTLSRWENGRGFPTNTYNKFLRMLEESVITPEQLKALQGPRKTIVEEKSNFFLSRPANIYYHDFKNTTPPPEAVEALMQSSMNLKTGNL